MSLPTRTPALLLSLSLLLLLLLLPVSLAATPRCAQSPDPGPCKARRPRWYFDLPTHKCRKFFWGGCKGTVPFRTRRACRRANCSACDLVPQTGPCRARFVRWFFDPVQKRCATFIWGGCAGLVPFTTRAACERKCPVDDACLQEPDPGPCRQTIPSYFYNPTTRMCEQFIYGGCKGNVPFRTQDKCRQATCRCFQKPDPGPCRGSFPRWFYDHDTGSCKMFTYGGCKGSVPFDSEEECQDADC